MIIFELNHAIVTKDELTIKLNSMQNVSMAIGMISKVDPEAGKEIVIRKHKKKRSLDQNALYWMWLNLLAAHFAKRGQKNELGEPISKDDMHDILRHKYLGYVDIEKRLGQTVITEHKLVSTAGMDKGDMHHYLSQIDE